MKDNNPIINVDEIKKIDFNSEEIIKSFEQIEKENEELLKSSIPCDESLRLRFTV